MIRFIYACMFVVTMSFVAVPIYKGVSKEHQNLVQTADAQGVLTSEEISFEDIYALADQGQDGADALNDITPAAGAGAKDEFSIGFQGSEDSALADNPK